MEFVFFSVGDRVDIGDDSYVVKEMKLLSSKQKRIFSRHALGKLLTEDPILFPLQKLSSKRPTASMFKFRTRFWQPNPSSTFVEAVPSKKPSSST